MASRCFSGSISDLTRPLSSLSHLHCTVRSRAADSAPTSDRLADQVYGLVSRSSEGVCPILNCSFARSRPLSWTP